MHKENQPSRWQASKHKYYNQYHFKRRKILSDDLIVIRLKFKVLRATIKQTDVANELGLSRTAINSVLNGQMRSKKILDKIKSYVDFYFDENNQAMAILFSLYQMNISQREIARQLDVNQSFVCRAIHGKINSQKVNDYIKQLLSV